MYHLSHILYTCILYIVMLCKINICLDIVVLSGIRKENWVGCNEQLLPRGEGQCKQKEDFCPTRSYNIINTSLNLLQLTFRLKDTSIG